MTTSYELFDPPRRPEEYTARLPAEVLEETARASLAKRQNKYLVKGEWTLDDGSTELDFAINRAWVVENSNYQLVEGRLRWVCPGCGRMSGAHTKQCDYER